MRIRLRALVTRPREDAEAVAELLRRKGIEPVIEPLLVIEPRPEGLGETGDTGLAGVQAVLLTSANGARALAAATAVRGVPVFAVGEATARAARERGFESVESAGGDVDDLARLVASRLDPGGGALLHGAGGAVAGDLAGRLAEGGFEVRRVVLYEARRRDGLSPATAAAFREGGIDMALFFSPRTAATFVTLAAEADIVAACRQVTAFCLSPAVAEAASELSWRRVRCAARPELPALMEEIDAALSEGGGGAQPLRSSGPLGDGRGTTA
jgi:uroporphyrinogen-III synthase